MEDLTTMAQTRRKPIRNNTVVELADGWYCMVNGQLHGAWACREYALAGLQVEQRRAEQRAFKEIVATLKDEGIL
jgi:hypothetical protein